jgi:hypothetical protein
MLVIGAGDAIAGRFGHGGAEGALRLRHFTAELPAGAPGEVMQVGVRLPKNALIAKTEVLVDSADKGNGKNWSKCDVNDKTCAIGDAHIVRFHRGDQERWQELAVDVRNDGAEARFVKLKVLFQPQTGKDRSGCSRNNPQCGFASNLSQ